MDWKQLMKGLRQYSEQSKEREEQITHEKAREEEARSKRIAALCDQYRPQVEEVFKDFALNVGMKTHKEGGYFWIVDRRGNHLYGDQWPSVFLASGGVMIRLPSEACESERKCKGREIGWTDGQPEGYYFREERSSDGDTYHSDYYFIPFQDFTQEKLAQKLIELYKEANEERLRKK